MGGTTRSVDQIRTNVQEEVSLRKGTPVVQRRNNHLDGSRKCGADLTLTAINLSVVW